jgi:DNA-binding transcriptional ArsR family regulator
MTNNKSDEFSIRQQEIADVARLLSHPARLAIIELIAEKKEIRTGNISDYLPLSRTTVSQHLEELRKMGVICGSIDGLKIHYCLDQNKLKVMQEKLTTFFNSALSDFNCVCD